MKKINFLFAVFTFSVTICNSQSEWAPIGARWSNEYDNYNPTAKTFWTFTSVKDTFVLNKQCRKIVNSRNNSYFLMYAEKEKVYYSYKDTFLLLYDFTLKAGDSFYIPRLFRDGSRDTIKSKYFVLAVDSINISGKFLKRQNLSFLPQSHEDTILIGHINGYVIEKIGCLNYLFGFPMYLLDEWPDHLKCYEDSEISYKVRADFNCNGLDGISEVDIHNEIQLYPNPTSDKIYIGSSIGQDLIIQVYNTFGKCVMQKELYNFTNVIDLSTLTKGIYILKITIPSGTIEKKIIKE